MLAELAQGDLGALGELYDRYARDIYDFVRRVAPTEDAEDVVHSVFVRLTRLAASFRGTGSARPWLFGVATRVLRERRRSLARLTRALVRYAAEPRAPSAPPSSAGVDIDRGLSLLSEAKRVTLILAEVEGFTCEEIASLLGVPIGTIWTRLYHARRELRRYCGDET